MKRIIIAAIGLAMSVCASAKSNARAELGRPIWMP